MRRVTQLGLILITAFAVAGCAGRSELASLPPGQAPEHLETVFLGTTRALAPNGFSSERADALSFARYDISVPSQRQVGSIPQPEGPANARQHFLVADGETLESRAAFESALRAALAARPVDERNLVVYVHGYNNTFADSLYRTAQMRYDFEVPALAVHFAWPSLEAATGYVYDRDSILTARDDLEAFLRILVRVAPADVILVAHSMGSQLTMETLRTLSLSGGRSTLADIDGVILLSPDIDIDVFRAQASRIDPLPKPFVIFTSRLDRALRLSARISRRPERLGNIGTVDDVADFDITLIDTSEFEGGAGDRFDHMAAVTSPAMINLLRQANQVDRVFQSTGPRDSEILQGTVQTFQGATRILLAPITAVTGP